jgi:cytochrome c-type biogenesis protein CcmH
MKKVWFAILLTLLLAGLAAGAALAQQPTPSDDEVNAIAKQLYCPVCENIPLDVCPTQACAQWRELIREKLAAGWTEQQIKDYFVEQYGARVLGTPPARGMNWLVYLVPPVAILAGAYVLIRALHSWKQTVSPPASAPAAETPPSDEYVARLEEELRKR